MLNRSHALTWISAVALLGLAACDKSESPTAAAPGAQPQSREASGAAEAVSGRPATPEEVKLLMANREKLPTLETPAMASDPSKGAAKTAVNPTCTIDFNQSFGLSLIPGHASNTFVVSPYYDHLCNNQFYVYTSPINLDHFHLSAEAADQCYGTGNNWGHNSASGCINQSDAMYWPRLASNMGSNTGVRFIAKDGAYTVHNFDLGAVYVKYGTMDLYAYRVGVGWWHWPNLTSAQRWYWTGNNLNISEVDIYANNLNGTVTWDNLEIAIH